MSAEASEFDPVDLLVDEFLTLYRRGERPSLTEFSKNHPEHAERLQSLVPAMLVMEEFGGGNESSPRNGIASLHARMPERLGDYLLIRPIGSGGMGVVYEAIQESLGRHVALKTIPSSGHAEGANRLERFHREAISAARLHHAHIVPVFGIGEHEGLHFYTMQFIEGHGLDAVLREAEGMQSAPVADDLKAITPANRDLSSDLAWGMHHGRFLPRSSPGHAPGCEKNSRIPRLPVSRVGRAPQVEAKYLFSVAWIGVHVAEALDYAHRQGVLHRDIKPSNLLLDAQGHVWVTDFGLAKSQDDDELTRTGDVVGTLRYMAPERFSGWSDPRSDIFALGATLYELLAYRPAFDEPDRIRLIDRLLHGSPAPLRQRDRRFPRDLETIVLKALANAPGERYATARLLAEDLRRFVDGQPILARRSNLFERSWRWCRRNPAGAWGSIIVAVSLSAAVAMSMIYANEQGKAARDLARERKSLKESLTESRRILATRDFDRGQMAFEKDQDAAGLLWLMATWRSAVDAGDPTWQQLSRANVSAWVPRLPRLQGLLSHEGPVNAAVFSPDGRAILTGGEDCEARLWDAETAQPIGQPLRHPATVHSVAFSPDGKIALTGCGDGAGRLWDVAGGQLVAPLLRHESGVKSVAFSPDGKTVLTGSMDKTARLWDAATGLPIGQPFVAWGPISAVAFHPSGNMVATSSRIHRGVQLWNVSTGLEIGAGMAHEREVLSVAFTPDGKTLLTGCWFGTMNAWDVASQQQIGRELFRHRGHVRALAFSPDGKTYATGSEDKTARVWNAATNEPLGPPIAHQGPIVCVAFSADGRSLLTASSDHSVRVWNAQSCRFPEPTLAKPGAGMAVAFRGDGKSFLAADGGGRTRIWDVASGRQVGGNLLSSGENRSVACSRDGRYVLVAANPARLWDTSTDPPMGRDLSHPGGAAVVAFGPDSKIVATGGEDQTCRLWDVTTGEPIGIPKSLPGTVDALAFGPDGKTIVTGLDNGTAQKWSVPTWQPLGQVLSHSGAVSAVAFSPDGKAIVTGCEDGLARLWNPATGELIVPPLSHQAWVFAVAFSPDGKTVLTASRDMTARFWDAATGQPIGPPLRHGSSIWSACFAPDGKSILTGDVSNSVRVFKLAGLLPDDPEQVGTRIEVLTGLRLDATRGSILPLDNASWRAARDRLKQSDGSSWK